MKQTIDGVMPFFPVVVAKGLFRTVKPCLTDLFFNNWEQKSRMGPSLACREKSGLNGQNFQLESQVSQLLCVQKRYHVEEVDLGFWSLDGENSKH